MSLLGIGKLSRQKLSKVIRSAKGYITASLVATCLNVTRQTAQKLLSKWAKKGWLSRARPGIYLPVDMSAESSEDVFLDPWKIAAELFAPCYISGWSAAEYWELTEQIFETTIVLTSRLCPNKEYSIKKARFLLKKIPSNHMFGLKIVWRDRMKVQVADRHKTIIDMLDDPSLGGGILSVVDFFQSYLFSPESDLKILLDYAKKMENRTIFKRLGFILSILAPEKEDSIEFCLQNISKGNTQLDPAIKGLRLVKKWRLWIPENIEKQFRVCPKT